MKLSMCCFFVLIVATQLFEPVSGLEQSMRRSAQHNARNAMRGVSLRDDAVEKHPIPTFKMPYATDPRRTCTGYWAVGCVKVEGGNGTKFYYHDYVPELDRKRMSREVCWNFCSHVAGASYFGLEGGTKCFCSPFLDFESDKLPLAECDTPCAGDVGQFCGAVEKATVFQMHDCKNLPPTKCHQAPPVVENAKLFQSPAYYGKMIACYNLVRITGDHIANRRCNVECLPGYEETFNNIECKEMGNRSEFIWGEFHGRGACLPISCGVPEVVSMSRRPSGEVFFPDSVKYDCVIGHSITGKVSDPRDFSVKCTTTGKLVGYEKCLPVECGSPPYDLNAAVGSTWPLVYQQTASYTCLSGYTLNEHAFGDTEYTRKCMATGNFSDGRECKGVRCGNIPVYMNAKLSSKLPSNQQIFRYPMNLEYRCDAGFTTDGEKPAGSTNTFFGSSCKADGETTPPGSKCTRVSCGSPQPAKNAKWHPSEEAVFEDVVTYMCAEGYTTNGEADGPTKFPIKCLASGDFEEIKIDCLPVKCGNPPPVAKADVTKPCSESSSICTYEMEVEYTCKPGYSTREDDNAVAPDTNSFAAKCQENGALTDRPLCVNIDNCIGKTCGGHGTCVDHPEPTGVAFADWDCACHSGYEQRVVKGDKVCLNINDCPMGESFAANCSGAGKCQDSLNAYICDCDAGYKLTELKDSTNVTCAPLDCGSLPDVPDASHGDVEWPRGAVLSNKTKLKVPKDQMFYTQPAVEYKCDEGFTLDSTPTGKAKFKVECSLNGSTVSMTPHPEGCKPVSCGPPDNITYADKARPVDVMYYSKDVEERTLKYVCQPGYTADAEFHRYIPNSNFKVTCNYDGTLSGAESCVPVQCGYPPEIENGTVDIPKEKVLYGTSVEYTCNSGFSTDGTANEMTKTWSLTCTTQGRTTEKKACKPIICGEVDPVKNGKSVKVGWTLHYEQAASFEADPGHTLSGKADGETSFTMTCLASGSFDKSPLLLPFKPVTCGLAPSALQGHADLAIINTEKFFDEEVKYSCHTGYTLDGKPLNSGNSNNGEFTIKCQADGNFSDISLCKPVECKDLPSPSNATLEPTDQGKITYTESVAFKCKPGYSLLPNVLDTYNTYFQVACKPDGTFEPSPDCVNYDDCLVSDNQCGEGGHGHCKDLDPPPSGNHFDDFVCVCDAGFQASVKNGSEPQRFCENIDDCSEDSCKPGRCEDLILDYKCHCPIGHHGSHNCSKQACGNPPVVVNADVNTSGTQHYKDVSEYTCHTGYTLSGEVNTESTFTTTCKAKAGGGSEGNFSQIHTCKPVVCGVPDNLPHSRRSRGDEMTFGQTVTYTCETGYSTDRECHATDTVFEKICSADGTLHFSGTEASCLPVLAGTPDVPNADYQSGPMHFPDSRQVTCHAGYSIDGVDPALNSFTLTATANCSIEPADTCKILLCGKAPDEANADKDSEKNLVYSEVVNYTGHTGYTLNGKADGEKSISKLCDEDAKLSILPTLAQIAAARQSEDPSMLQSSKLSSPMSLDTWSGVRRAAGSLPFKPVECGEPPHVAHAYYSNAEKHYQQTVDYACEQGYSTDLKPEAEGGITNFTIVCQANGKFTPVKECKRIVCGTGPDVAHAKLKSKADIAYEGKATYQCNPGYSLDGRLTGKIDFNLTCLYTGNFNDAPKCLDMDDCEGSACGQGGTCEETKPPTGDHWKDHTCNCKSGYSLNVSTKNGKKYKTCGNIPDCPEGACLPGYCTDLVNDYKCHCPKGYHVGANAAEALKHDCLEDKCGTPPEFPHSSTSVRGDVLFGSMLKYSCDKGHTVDGSASGDQEFSIGCQLSNVVGKTVEFSEAHGCKPVQCPALPMVDNSSRSANQALVYNQKVTYTCDTGYSHLEACPDKSKFTLVCSDDGSYVNEDGTALFKSCKRVSAGTPPEGSLKNAFFGSYEMLYGDSQVVQCAPGYSTNPKDPSANTFPLEAAANCSWNWFPTCKSLNCGKAPTVNHGTSDKAGKDIFFPKTVTYTTDKCYTVDGTANGSRSISTECKADGKFKTMDSYLPLLPVNCGLPKEMPGATRASEEKTCGQEVTYKCKKGYTTDGKAPQVPGNKQFKEECKESGKFTKTGECKLVECPTLPSPVEVQKLPSGKHFYNDTITFDCKPGFSLDSTLDGDTKFTLRCGESATFSEAPGECSNINNCVSDDICGAHGTCEDLPVPTGIHEDDYTCKCDSGFALIKTAGKAPFCENIDDCAADSCKAKYPDTDKVVTQGTCHDLINNFHCSCPLGSYNSSDGNKCLVQSCGKLPTVPHTSDLGDHLQFYNQTYKYTCKDGYTLDGSSGGDMEFKVKCEGLPGNVHGGKRTGVAKCKPVVCAIPIFTNASTTAASFTYGDEIEYACEEGFSTMGSCLQNSKKSFSTKCDKTGIAVFMDAAQKGCHPNVAGIPQVKNARVPPVPMKWPESQVSTCMPGFSTDSNDIDANKFTIKTTKSCGFESHPKCVPVKCPVPNVSHATSSGGNTFGRKRDYKCEKGYTWDVNNRSHPKSFSIACQADGQFESPKECVPVVCGKIQSIRSADCTSALPKDADFVFKDKFSCTCQTGYTLSPAGSPDGAKAFIATCNEDGVFAGIQTCRPVSCGQPPSMDNAVTYYHLYPMPDVLFGGELYYVCDEGYNIAGKPLASEYVVAQCKADGKFSHHDECKDIDWCFDNKMCEPGGKCVDGLKDFRCDCSAGYELGPRNKSCKAINECEANDGDRHCGPGQCKDLLDKYECECPTGYTAKQLHNSSKAQSCEANVCEATPVVKNAVSSLPTGKSVIYQTQVTYDCHVGYTLNAEASGSTSFTIGCQADTTFKRINSSGSVKGDGKLLECRPVQCPELPKVDNAKPSKNLPPMSYISSPFNYTCEPGFSTNSDAEGPTGFSVQCLATGKLTDPEECKRVACHEAPQIAFAAFSPPTPADMFFQDSKTYTCLTGYTITGLASGAPKFDVQCNKTGGFVGLEACMPVRCGVPPSFENSSADSLEKVYKGEPHEVACDEGFEPAAFSLECLQNGSYSDHAGCKRISCGVPQPMANSVPKSSAKLYYTDTVIHECNDKFSLNGKEDGPTTFTRICNSNGDIRVHGHETQCKDIDFCIGNPCGNGDCYDVTLHPEKVPNTATFLQTSVGKPVASNEDYVCYCNEGYETTTVNGKLTCTEDDCHGDPCGKGGTCTDLSTAPNATAGAYSCTCHPGYEISTNQNGTSTCVPVVCEPAPPIVSHAGNPKHIFSSFGCDFQCYLDRYADLREKFGGSNVVEAAKHYEQYGKYEGRDCLCRHVTECNWQCYLDRYPALQDKLDPGYEAAEAHYERAGKNEGRDCTCRYYPGCNWKCYLDNNPELEPHLRNSYPNLDIHTAAKNHWETNGLHEGRDCTCPGSTPAAGERLPSNPKAVLYEDKIIYKCNAGYSLDGGREDIKFSATCSALGILQDTETGSASLGTCMPIVCGCAPEIPDTVPKLELSDSGKPEPLNTESPEVTYECIPGYELKDGLHTFGIRCLKTGKLSEGQNCKPKVCGKLDQRQLKYTTVSVASDFKFKFGDDAVVTCNAGYKITEGETKLTKYKIKCNANGQFSSYKKCEPMECAPGFFFGTSKIVRCPLGTTVDSRPEGLAYFTETCTSEGKIIGTVKCKPVIIFVKGLATDAADPSDAPLPDAEVTLGSTDYYPHSSIAYTKTAIGEQCPLASSATEVKSKSSCQAAAAALGNSFEAINTPNRHRYCFFNDDTVYFNIDASNTMPEPSSSSVCYKGPGMFTKFRILPAANTGEMFGKWQISSFDAYYTNDCSGSTVSKKAMFASSGADKVSQAFDGNPETFWKATCSNCNALSEYVGFETTEPTVVRCLKIRQCSSTGCAPTLRIQGAEMGTSKWINLVLSAEAAAAGEFTTIEKIPAVITQDTTGSDGKYKVQASLGNYVITASKANFITSHKYITLDSVNARGPRDVNLPLSRVLRADELRLVLEWHDKSEDLDMWLFFGDHAKCMKKNNEAYTFDWDPSSSCSYSCLIFYGYMQSSCHPSVTAYLENDDTDGNGPETLRIQGMGKCTRNCKMIFAVDNYIHSAEQTSRYEMLGKSGGKVKIYMGSREKGTFELPPTQSTDIRQRNWWEGPVTVDKRWTPLLVIDASANAGPTPFRYWDDSKDWDSALN